MKDKVLDMIMESLVEVKEDNDLDFDVSKDLFLLGSKGVMDSLDFVKFVMYLEEKILDETDQEVTLLTDKAFSQKRSPFYNVESLQEYIVEVIS